jgi:hypothetical protein
MVAGKAQPRRRRPPLPVQERRLLGQSSDAGPRKVGNCGRGRCLIMLARRTFLKPLVLWTLNYGNGRVMVESGH